MENKRKEELTKMFFKEIDKALKNFFGHYTERKYDFDPSFIEELAQKGSIQVLSRISSIIAGHLSEWNEEEAAEIAEGNIQALILTLSDAVNQKNLIESIVENSK